MTLEFTLPGGRVRHVDTYNGKKEEVGAGGSSNCFGLCLLGLLGSMVTSQVRKADGLGK